MEKQEQLQNRVIELVAKTLNQNTEKISINDILENLAEDSIALFSLIAAFEEEFAFEAEYDEVVEIITVNDIVNYLKKKDIR